MVDPSQVARLTGSRAARAVDRIQSLWRGYGEVVRYALVDGPAETVVVKHVHPPAEHGVSHRRKLRSYGVEQAFYTDVSPDLPEGCRVPHCYGVEGNGASWCFVFEDLHRSGFVRRPRSEAEVFLCLRWLASFHAAGLGAPSGGLWPRGTYWQLGTRQEEWQAMAPSALRRRATEVHERLLSCAFQTRVHGDAKPANFLVGAHGVAAVDFQYTGGGIGVQDVVYLLDLHDAASTERALAHYFDALAEALVSRGLEPEPVCAAWRALVPWAWADFQRFLEGWAPGSKVPAVGQAWTRSVLGP